MKCYIATYYKYNNYGTRLQNYALVTFLNTLNIEASTIYLKSEEKNYKDVIFNNIKKILIFLPNVTKKQKNWKDQYLKEKKFRNFNNELNLKQYTREELYQIQFNSDIAIAGSDQIWSPNHFISNPNDIDLFFLDFVPRLKRVSYAPSFGVEQIPESLKEMYKTRLSNFRFLSVRETAGKKIIEKTVNNTEVVLVPDPVFLLSAREWRNIYEKKSRTIKNDYILTYFLGIHDNSVQEEINKFAKKYNCNVINISGNFFEKDAIVATPYEFLQLIDNAKYVFTDSFHACAFSVIFESKFIVLKRPDVKQFSRIETLLSDYGCEHASVEKIDVHTIESIFNLHNYFNLECLHINRKTGQDFLINSISKCGG